MRARAVELDERGVQRRFARLRGIAKQEWTLARAKALALTLAQAKRSAAEAGLKGRDLERDLVLGCDQVVLAKGQIFGKPGTHARAVKMLKGFSGEKIYLINAMSMRGSRADGKALVLDDVQVIEMRFSKLALSEIERVLRLDQPYAAAGSFHFESHGANLLKSVLCDDPTGIQGLPVMRLKALLSSLKR